MGHKKRKSIKEAILIEEADQLLSFVMRVKQTLMNLEQVFIESEQNPGEETTAAAHEAFIKFIQKDVQHLYIEAILLEASARGELPRTYEEARAHSEEVSKNDQEMKVDIPRNP